MKSKELSVLLDESRVVRSMSKDCERLFEVGIEIREYSEELDDMFEELDYLSEVRRKLKRALTGKEVV